MPRVAFQEWKSLEPELAASRGFCHPGRGPSPGTRADRVSSISSRFLLQVQSPHSGTLPTQPKLSWTLQCSQ